VSRVRPNICALHIVSAVCRVEVVELWRHCDAVKDKTKVVRPHKFGLFLGRIFSGLLGLSGRS
jgi:hypothetical protein